MGSARRLNSANRLNFVQLLKGEKKGQNWITSSNARSEGDKRRGGKKKIKKKKEKGKKGGGEIDFHLKGEKRETTLWEKEGNLPIFFPWPSPAV